MTRHTHTANGSEPGPLICETCGQRFGAVEQEDAHGWRPIATAPRDGTRVLVGYKSHCVYRVTLAWYVTDTGYSGSDSGWYCDVGFVPPTHWQPLPPPPSEETER